MVSLQKHFYHSIKSVHSLFVQTTSKLCVCFVVDKFVMKKTGYLFRSLQSNCTLPTIFIFTLYYTPIPYFTILYYTIRYYTTLRYATLYSTILYHTILYYTILYYTIYYGILILYYTHTILLFTRCCGNSEGRTLKLPEWGILLRSSAAWLLKTSIMTYQKHSFFCIATVFSCVWIKLCSEYFEEKGQLTY